MPKERKATHQPFEGSDPRGAFTKLTADMMASDAWSTLPMRARALYVEFKRQYTQHRTRGIVDYTNKDDISMPVSRWKPLYDGYQDGFIADRDELIRRGFIKMVSNGHVRKPNIYAFSDEWKLWRPPANPLKKKNKNPGDTSAVHTVYYTSTKEHGASRGNGGAAR